MKNLFDTINSLFLSKITPANSLNKELRKDNLIDKYNPDFVPSSEIINRENLIKNVLIGISLGDISGSKYEGISLRQWEDPDTIDMFDKGHYFTDDTVLSIAVMKATYELLKNNADTKTKIDTYSKFLRTYTRRYDSLDYGYHYYTWATDETLGAYQSCGNGSAMRSGIIGSMFESVEDVILYAYYSAMPTHDDEEGIKGAIVTAVCVWMASHGASKNDIRSYLIAHYPENNGFKVNGTTTLDDMVNEPLARNILSTVCQITVPEAVINFLESNSFEECLRNAQRYLCDRDTVAAISGGIAAAYYNDTSIGNVSGINIINEYLPLELLEDINSITLQ